MVAILFCCDKSDIPFTMANSTFQEIYSHKILGIITNTGLRKYACEMIIRLKGYVCITSLCLD